MTLRDALLLGRVSNLPTVWTNVLCGTVLAGAAIEPLGVGLVVLAMSLFYVGGMYLNDAFDREIDARERPERPIPSGRVSARLVFGVGFGLLAAGIGLLAVCGWLSPGRTTWRAPAVGLALAATIVLYDRHHKGNPLSPLIMGLCRVWVYVGAALVWTSSPPVGVWLAAAALLGYLIGLTYAAKQENLARFQGAWPLLFLAAPILVSVPAVVERPIALIPLAILAGWTLHAVSFLLKKPPSIGGAIVRFIAGIALVDALLVASQGEWFLAGLCGVGFALTLLFQRVIPGT